MRFWTATVFILLLSYPGFALAKGKRTIETYSSREDLAGDVPKDQTTGRFLVRDNMYGVRVSNQGAPVVQFYGDEPLIVGFVAPGKVVELTSLRVYKGINYWPMAYVDEKGQSKEGWISGLFVERKAP
jgi:hypothetical protein